MGNHRFTDIAWGTGAPRDRLTARLNDLVEVGVLERRQYRAAPPRSGYQLTASGRDLLPVLQALLQWGDRWVAEEPPVHLHHGPPGSTGDHRIDMAWVCRTCGEPVSLPVGCRSWRWWSEHPYYRDDPLLWLRNAAVASRW